jgi:peptidoglycan/xylan/chitin deacetylase (PgdA/CDA1 family)
MGGEIFTILKSYEACATVFLPTDYIGTGKMFWTEHLAHLLAGKKDRHADILQSESPYHTMIGNIEKMKGPVDSKVEQAAEALKSLPSEEIERIMGDLAERWQVAPCSRKTSFLSWGEVREMRRSGIVSFGSHTKSHRILTTVPEDGVRDELTQSRKKLIEERAVSHSFIPFAYPNGNHTDRITEMVEEAGYHLALTTRKGWNHIARMRGEFYTLKRIGIHQDMTSTNAMLACRIYGIF